MLWYSDASCFTNIQSIYRSNQTMNKLKQIAKVVRVGDNNNYQFSNTPAQ